MDSFEEWVKNADHPCCQDWGEQAVNLGASWDSFNAEDSKPAQHPELGRWAEEQQQLYERKQIGRGRESNLTDEQEAKLMAVGFVFVPTLNILDDDDDDDDDIYSI